MLSLEESLDAIYKGQANVAKLAKSLNITTAELKDKFRDYAKARPIDSEAWHKDIEICWPFHT
jgi:hypothetical protein